MDVTAIMEKQSKTLEELLPYKKCQKIPKILGRWLLIVTDSKGGDKLYPSL